MKSGKTALVVIDVQRGFDDPYWGERNNPYFEQNIARLIDAFRQHKWPVIHVRHMSTSPHSPLRPGQSGNAFKPEAMPEAGEKIIEKTVNSAFIGTELEAYLKEQGIGALVLCGLTTDHCVSTTTRMAGNLGFDTMLVSDATATFDRAGIDGHVFSADEIHQTALASLSGEFAWVMPLDQLLPLLQLIR